MKFRDRYQYDPKTDLLGKGGFAKVYKGYDHLRRQTVALKFYKSDLSEKYSLFREIQRVINLEHRNICKYFDIVVLESVNTIGEEERTEVGIMEYLDGGDIRHYTERHPHTRDGLLLDVLEGIAYLHRNKLIHRDLKPSNILVATTPAGPVAKITDFGISKSMDGGATKSSDLLGTIEYMAPEQFNPQKYGSGGQLSYNLDLWSWGCLAYEIIRSEPLFGSRSQGQSTEQVLMNILHEDYVSKIRELPSPYNEALLHCLVKEAEKRVQSAEQLLALIKAPPAREATRRIILLEETPAAGSSPGAKAPAGPIDVKEAGGQLTGKGKVVAPQAPMVKKRTPATKRLAGVLAVAMVVLGLGGWLLTRYNRTDTEPLQPTAIQGDSLVQEDFQYAANKPAVGQVVNDTGLMTPKASVSADQIYLDSLHTVLKLKYQWGGLGGKSQVRYIRAAGALGDYYLQKGDPKTAVGYYSKAARLRSGTDEDLSDALNVTGEKDKIVAKLQNLYRSATVPRPLKDEIMEIIITGRYCGMPTTREEKEFLSKKYFKTTEPVLIDPAIETTAGGKSLTLYLNPYMSAGLRNNKKCKDAFAQYADYLRNHPEVRLEVEARDAYRNSCTPLRAQEHLHAAVGYLVEEEGISYDRFIMDYSESASPTVMGRNVDYVRIKPAN